MHNLDPNEMDALFREGAEKYEFSYNPKAWAMMEEKLDARRNRRYLLWLFFGSLLIAAAIGMYLYTSSIDNNQLHSDLAIIEKKKEKENKPQDNTVPIEKKESINNDIDPSGDLSTSSNKQINAGNIKATANEVYINTDSKVRSSNIGAQNSFQSENTGSLVDNEVVSVSSPRKSTDDVYQRVDEMAKPNDADDIKVLPIVSNTPSNEQLMIPYLKGLEFIPIDKKATTIDAKELEIVPERIVARSIVGNRFALTILGASEYSSVGLFNETTAGWKAGAKIGYQFSDKYQLDLGIAFSQKKYGSEGSEYTNTDGWVDGIKPMWMDAKCSITEIPVELSYYLNGYRNSGFFFNAGISSYILNSEWYGFEYDEALSRPDLLKEINPEDVEMNYHISGVGKISFGYQKIISPAMALEISPYLHIPLTGIGEGKVDLYTAGVQFAVKFNTK